MQQALIHAAILQDAARFAYVFIEPEIIRSSCDKSCQPYSTYRHSFIGWWLENGGWIYLFIIFF